MEVNACCYHNGPTIISAKKLCQDEGVCIQRLDFSNPQGGKGSCDRKAATIKSHMRLHLNAGNDVATGDEMMKAIKSSGGVPGVAVKLSELAAGQQSELSALKLAIGRLPWRDIVYFHFTCLGTKKFLHLLPS